MALLLIWWFNLQQFIKLNASYLFFFVGSLLIVWLNNHLDLRAQFPSSNIVICGILFCTSYLCYLKLGSKSFKLLWLYSAIALLTLALGQLIYQHYSPSALIVHSSTLLAWLFAFLAIETTPNVGETPQSQFTSRRVSAIVFSITLFTYLVLIPKHDSSFFAIENNQIELFNMLLSLVLTFRLFEGWQSSNIKGWKTFYGLAIVASLIFCLGNGFKLMSLAPSNGTHVLLASIVFLLLTFFTLKNKETFTAKKYQFSAEMYLIIQIMAFTGLHLSLTRQSGSDNLSYPLESLLYAIWMVGVLGFLAYIISKSRHKQQANELNKQSLQHAIESLEKKLVKLNEALIFSEEKAIVASSSNAILTASTNGEILSANPAAVQMFQYLEDELIGQTIATLFDDNDELHFFFNYQSNVFSLERKKSGISKESLCKRADGHEFPAQVEMQWAERKGSPLIVITFINLTSRKLAEQQTLEQKDAFLANVSHEFRTPLTLINGVIDKFIESAKNKNEVEDLITAKRNSLRLVRMVEQLLELSKMQESPSLNTATYELSHLLQMPLDSFRQLCVQQSLGFTCNIPDALYLECDAEAFEKIIFNLVANAVKYTQKGGEITVNAYKSGSDILIDVIDTGIGISQSFQNVIFNRFERVQEPASIAQFGVGIGLSLVNELVKAHHWRISLISEPKKGSKFTLHIPAATQTDKTQLATASISHQEISTLLLDANQSEQKLIKPEDKRVVLLIEDNKDMQQHVQQLLDTQHHCITADDGESGIALAVEYIPDIIVCDIMLTGIDGFEVLTFLKNHEATSHIPVILLTARSDLESRLKGLGLQADEYLGKPFNRKELLTRIDSLIENRRRLKQVYVGKYMDAQQKQRKQQSHQHISHLTESEMPETSADDNFLNKLEQFVAKHYTNPQLEIAEIASHLAMSERQLQRKIRVLLGSTPNHYLKEFRLSKAKEALAMGKPIGHIALDVGFSSQTYFGRCFKEKYDMTPKQYQSSLEK
ncbi:ATP-binding protein [Thalassotalea fusca]